MYFVMPSPLHKAYELKVASYTQEVKSGYLKPWELSCICVCDCEEVVSPQIVNVMRCGAHNHPQPSWAILLM